MAIERHRIASRDQWLNELRAPYVTASVASATIALHDFITPFELWSLKAGLITDDPEVTPAMERGTILEGPAFELLKRDFPELQIRWNGTPGKIDGEFFCDPVDRIGATPDAFASCPQRGPGTIQVKSVEASIFRRKWINPDTGDVAPPLGTAIQAILEAHLTNSNWCAVAALVIGHGIDLHMIPMPIHQGVIDRIRVGVADLWKMVAEGRPPPADYARDGALIARLFPIDDGSTIDFSADNRMPGMVDRLEEIKACLKNLGGEKSEIETEIKGRMGPHSYATLSDGRTMSLKLTQRAAYQVAATEYRTLRIEKQKGRHIRGWR
jgi:predicted phage-related endonuclease